MRVRKRISGASAIALFLVTAFHLAAAEGDPAILELRVIEGDGTAYSIGSRATRGVTVQVSDESGRPVTGATVSFTLPQDGPSGVFVSGGRSEIVATRADGRATVWGMQWNRMPGPFEIRITAAKGQARAGILCTLYLNDGRSTEVGVGKGKANSIDARALGNRIDVAGEHMAAVAATTNEPARRAGSGGHKWIWIAVGVAGAAAAGTTAIIGRNANSVGSSATTAGTVQIGTPSVTLGRP